MIAIVSEDKFINLRISQNAKDAISDFAEQSGMKEKAVASRLYEWFARLDPQVQYAIVQPDATEPTAISDPLAKLIRQTHPRARGRPPEKGNGRRSA